MPCIVLLRAERTARMAKGDGAPLSEETLAEAIAA